MMGGYEEEARAWREWLLRAVAGRPAQLQIMYGIGRRAAADGAGARLAAGLRGLCGRCGSATRRISQLQLDVYGEVMDALHVARRVGLPSRMTNAWRVQRGAARVPGVDWREPDEGIWEVRGAARHFTHSKVMAWVALRSGREGVERFGLRGPSRPLARNCCAEIHEEVCRAGLRSAARTRSSSHYGVEGRSTRAC